ncbi:UDP-N-acetylglucosamine 2-epimerase [Laribacter hongkongensis]|uniref:UDP-N-acetylglucosamine 2-epimerase n=1 Tax=Laribacter hongkongensis TaxID=168471 RepID=UPI001EFCCB48|nr:UDP-N-acetylglucosamine 2-epimerase [Laribacter hongkongensis]MCG9051745.1 UDP-N-acetylglucosamine 2-epimerase [Laribacter hongkongensis]
MTRKICVVTGTRAEYGLLRWLMQAIAQDPALQLQLLVTGMHLSPEFGLTWQAIEQDGFHIDRKVEMLLSSDTPAGITKSVGLGMIGFADALEQLAPDMLLILGDRFEILAAASAAMAARIPIAHLHGGEVTEGVIDEAIRHAVTKMSHFHFVASQQYRRRVIQLGEDPARVFAVGGIGLDSLARLPLMSRAELEAALSYRFQPRNLLVTFHPVTLEANTASAEFGELLAALHELQDTGLIFTLPNADTDSRALIRMVEDFVHSHPAAHAYASLGQLRYLSCMKEVDGVVGNSSSGIIEAPSMHKGSINIGARQEGRTKALSVIDCQPDRSDIAAALSRLYSPDFQAQLPSVRNPYGEPGASDKIAALLGSLQLEGVLKKKFFDLDPGVSDIAREAHND